MPTNAAAARHHSLDLVGSKGLPAIGRPSPVSFSRTLAVPARSPRIAEPLDDDVGPISGQRLGIGLADGPEVAPSDSAGALRNMAGLSMAMESAVGKIEGGVLISGSWP